MADQVLSVVKNPSDAGKKQILRYAEDGSHFSGVAKQVAYSFRGLPYSSSNSVRVVLNLPPSNLSGPL